MNPMGIFQTFILIAHYVNELSAAGPDFLELAKDTMRAINDFRAGKLTSAELSEVFDDVKAILTKLSGTKPPTEIKP